MTPPPPPKKKKKKKIIHSISAGVGFSMYKHLNHRFLHLLFVKKKGGGGIHPNKSFRANKREISMPQDTIKLCENEKIGLISIAHLHKEFISHGHSSIGGSIH